MITNDFLKEILINPIQLGVNKLEIISGYASAAMVFKHFQEIDNLNLSSTNIQINLIIGMANRDGISKPDHENYIKFMESEFKDRFSCSYIFDDKPVHSKVYTWLRDETPVKAFMGSCNYSQAAFIKNTQKEVAYECDAKKAHDYFLSNIPNTLFCYHQDAEQLLDLYKYRASKILREEDMNTNFEIDGLEKATVSLLDRDGNVPETSQLNWGQRMGREPNQAYFQLKPEVYRSDFFPVKGIHFSVLTDDGKTLVCTRAQKDERGHAIETPHNNSLLGEYIRFRLGLKNGEKVTLQDLLNYGRTTIDFYKVDDESYFMDFSKT